MNLPKLKRDMKKLANPAKAKVLAGFFKTGPGQYGEGDIFLGITVPLQRQLVKQYWQDLTMGDVDSLIKSKFHEERLIALLILVKQFQSLNIKSSIFKFYLSHTKYINNWDLVDLSAPNIVGEYLIDKNRTILFKLAKSKNLWERRIAILATFAFIKKRDPKDSLAIAKMLLADKQDLIHKAVGWMLREIGKRCGEKILTDFLDKNVLRIPRTALRYAIERLPEKKRLHYLHLT
ncbi:MAG: DNA alkylation repair protein [Candidatus Doudnabacteria bacterium]|jgi:3-methyladenine DNA glycosylase AlkD